MAESTLKHKTKVGVYWKALEQFGNHGTQFIVGIVMARLLTPEDYGITALPAVFMAIASLFVDCGFSSALVRKKEVTEKDLSTAFYYSIVIGVICYIAFFFSSPWIAEFYSTPVLEKLMRITALTFLITPLNTPQNVLLQRKLDFKTPTQINVCTKIIGGVTGIICAYCGWGLWALVISTLTSTILTMFITWLVVRWIPREKWSTDSFKYLFGYGSKMLFTFLIDRIYMNITPVVIGKYYSPAQLGVYNRSLNYAQLPSNQLTSVISSVTFPVLSKVQSDNEKLAENYRKMLKCTAFVIFPLMTLLCVLAKPFIVLLITEKWLDCVPYLQLMCIWWVWIPIHSLNLNLILVKGRSDLFLRLEIIKKSIGLCIMCITLPMGILQFLYGSILNSFISLFINTYYTGKFINVGFLKQMMDLVPLLCMCVLMGGIVYVINLFIASLIFQFVIGLTLGTILYLGTAYFANLSELEDVKYMLNRKK